MKNVIVSGMGAISVLGTGVRAFWDRLIAGQSGIRNITGFATDNLRNILAGEIELTRELLDYGKRQNISNRLNLFAYHAIDEAIRDSGLSMDLLKEKRTGIIMGTSLGMSLIKGTIVYSDNTIMDAGNLEENLSLLNRDVCMRYPVSGDVMIISTACASGTHGIGLARDMILHEGYDVVICGGADSLDRMKYLGHSALSTLTQTEIKPCDASRSGTLFGEGAGFLVLEKENALGDERFQNGRMPHAICSGAGYSCDAYHLTTPDPEGRGAVYAMKDALNDAGLGAEDINYINLHGSGTNLNDTVEAHAIREVFGALSSAVPATSIKAAISHAMGAAGALEAISTILSIMHSRIPVTLNVSSPDPALGINLVYQEPYKGDIEHAMSNSFGFGGSNGVLIFSKYQRNKQEQ